MTWIDLKAKTCLWIMYHQCGNERKQCVIDPRTIIYYSQHDCFEQGGTCDCRSVTTSQIGCWRLIMTIMVVFIPCAVPISPSEIIPGKSLSDWVSRLSYMRLMLLHKPQNSEQRWPPQSGCIPPSAAVRHANIKALCWQNKGQLLIPPITLNLKNAREVQVLSQFQERQIEGRV